MLIQIIAVGHKMPQWVTQAFEDYTKRMPSDCKIQLKELKPEHRQNNSNPVHCMAKEAERILAALAPNSYLIILDERGKDLTSQQLAQQWQTWQQLGQPIAIVIGGADGLSPMIKEKAQFMLRLSSLTLPHGMVRVLLAEQLYRAHTITTNHPYHRD